MNAVNLVALLNAPWLQPLVGLLVTVLGSWLGARSSGSADGGISQNAVTHGQRSSVTQTINQNTWQISEPARAQPTERQQTTHGKAPNDENDLARIIGLGAAAVVGIAALTWGVASNWGVVSVTLRLVVLAAMFVIALTWWRWPAGVVGAWNLRIAITAVGSAVLWAVTILPNPVGNEPSLGAIDVATRQLDIGDSIGRTISMLGMHGIFAYELRLGGLFLLLVLLATMARRGLGAVIAESAARHNPPRLSLLTFGNRFMGTAKMGFAYFAGTFVMGAIAVLIIHPDSVGWLVALVQEGPVMQP